MTANCTYLNLLQRTLLLLADTIIIQMLELLASSMVYERCETGRDRRLARLLALRTPSRLPTLQPSLPDFPPMTHGIWMASAINCELISDRTLMDYGSYDCSNIIFNVSMRGSRRITA